MIARCRLWLAIALAVVAVPLVAQPRVVRPDYTNLPGAELPPVLIPHETPDDPGTVVTPVTPVVAKRWWLRRALEIAIPVQGIGAVRATIIGSGASTTPGAVRCRFDGPIKTTSVTPENGVARLGFFGWLIPSPRFAVLQPGDCHFTLAVSRQALDGTWGSVSQIDAPAFPVVPHVRVVISDTARMRAWLLPMHGPGCADDDRDGKLAMRISTGAAGNDCRIDFLTMGNRTRADWNVNALPEGVISSTVDWRVAGSTRVCELCSDTTGTACRGIGPPPEFPYTRDLIGPEVRTGGMTGDSVAMFTGPPTVPARGDVIEPRQGVIIATNAQGIWRSYAFTQYSRMSCTPWAPTPDEVKRTANEWVKSAQDRIDAFGHDIVDPLLPRGRGRSGPAQIPGPPPPPPTPSLWLVLHSWEFLKAPGTTLPWE